MFDVNIIYKHVILKYSPPRSDLNNFMYKSNGPGTCRNGRAKDIQKNYAVQ